MSGARDVLASMLDELMGKYRNVLPSERPPDITFEDPDVCKYFLVGFCHHELFTNTKADLGPCRKTHDEKLRDDYRSSDKFEKLGYEDVWLVELQRLQNDIERKVRRNKQRLDVTQPGGKIEDASREKVEAKIKSLSEQMTELLEQAESLGAKGQVDNAQKLIEITEELKEEREHCRKSLDTPAPEQKTMDVCETCGCLLIVGDSHYRIEEHLVGKQHLGCAKIAATIDELIKRKEERRLRELEEFKKEAKEQDVRRQSQGSRYPARRSRSRDRDSRDNRRRRSRSSSHSNRHQSSRYHDRDTSSRHYHHRHRSRSKERRHSTKHEERSTPRQSSSRYSSTDKSPVNKSGYAHSRSPVSNEKSAIPKSINGSTNVKRSSSKEADSLKVNAVATGQVNADLSGRRGGHTDDELEEGQVL